ncbi:MAG TPA: DUF2339 domain-containing protein, partial [Thermoanaerobaculia bacterium]|nr:DUF2339 domain-containing protein [Thermoanaerobaculia bacterium]
PPAELPIPAAESIFLPPRVEEPRPPAREVPAFDWENVIGVKLFAWLGGGALFLAAALFLQYSIQHDLISPRARVAIGLIVGAAAIALGGPAGRRASRAGQAIAGAGAAILYASLYAAHALYHLVSAGAATAAMAAVTALAGFLAVKRNAFMLAVLALVGGFATPVLLSTGEDRALSLLVYTALLDAGIVLVARRRRWDALSLLGVFGSAVLFTGWATRFLDPERIGAAMIAAGALGAIFLFSSDDRETAEGASRAVGTSAAGLLFALALSVAPNAELRVPPAFLVGYLLVLCAGAWRIASERRAERLFPAAAAATIGALVLRVAPDLFPSRRAEALLLFAAVPAAFAATALLARRGAMARQALSGAVLALGGTLLVLARIADVEPASASIPPDAAFAAFVAALGIVLGAASRDGRWAIGAEAYAFVSLSLFLGRCSPGRLPEFLPAIVVPGLFFWALPFFAPALREGASAWIAAAASPVLFYSVLYAEARERWGDTTLGVLAIALGLLAFGSLRRAVAL